MRHAGDFLAGGTLPDPHGVVHSHYHSRPSGHRAEADRADPALMRHAGDFLAGGTLQTRTVLSSLPLTTKRPSGLKLTALTESSCASCGRLPCRWYSPRPARCCPPCHSRPSGHPAEATALTACAAGDFLAGGTLPDPRGLVPAATHDQAAIGLKLTALTESSCVMRATSLPVVLSQTRTVLSHCHSRPSGHQG